VDRHPSVDHPPDANARIFRRFRWDPGAAHREPPNVGAYHTLGIFTGRLIDYYEWDPDREITLQ
jgi:hypothetical protein